MPDKKRRAAKYVGEVLSKDRRNFFRVYWYEGQLQVFMGDGSFAPVERVGLTQAEVQSQLFPPEYRPDEQGNFPASSRDRSARAPFGSTSSKAQLAPWAKRAFGREPTEFDPLELKKQRTLEDEIRVMRPLQGEEAREYDPQNFGGVESRPELWTNPRGVSAFEALDQYRQVMGKLHRKDDYETYRDREFKAVQAFRQVIPREVWEQLGVQTTITDEDGVTYALPEEQWDFKATLQAMGRMVWGSGATFDEQDVKFQRHYESAVKNLVKAPGEAIPKGVLVDISEWLTPEYFERFVPGGRMMFEDMSNSFLAEEATLEYMNSFNAGQIEKIEARRRAEQRAEWDRKGYETARYVQMTQRNEAAGRFVNTALGNAELQPFDPNAASQRGRQDMPQTEAVVNKFLGGLQGDADYKSFVRGRLPEIFADYDGRKDYLRQLWWQELNQPARNAQLEERDHWMSELERWTKFKESYAAVSTASGAVREEGGAQPIDMDFSGTPSEGILEQADATIEFIQRRLAEIGDVSGQTYEKPRRNPLAPESDPLESFLTEYPFMDEYKRKQQEKQPDANKVPWTGRLSPMARWVTR